MEELCEAVRKQAELVRKEDDGAELKDHLTAAARQGDETAAAALREGETPRLSPEAEHVMQWFWTLKAAAPAGFSASIITFESIESWAKLFNLWPLPWEVRAIRAMDSIFNATISKKRK
jgi:hypothetical protein